MGFCSDDIGGRKRVHALKTSEGDKEEDMEMRAMAVDLELISSATWIVEKEE